MGILQSGGLVNKIKDIGRGVINLVFPPRCPVCDGIIGPSEESIVTTAHGHSSITGRCGRMTATGRARRFLHTRAA